MNGKFDVCVCIPINPAMCPELKQAAYDAAIKIPACNPGLNIGLYFDTTKVEGQPTDRMPWAKVARVRNMMLDRIDVAQWTHLLWIDADVIHYPADLPTRLLRANPSAKGVVAPMVLVENSDRFYDWAAFIIEGQSSVDPGMHEYRPGRNLTHEPPYWPSPRTGVVRMDCVGAVTLVDTDIYLGDGIDVRYSEHPAFTDHYAICEAARMNDLPVLCDTNTVVYHADLPKYGELWH